MALLWPNRGHAKLVFVSKAANCTLKKTIFRFSKVRKMESIEFKKTVGLEGKAHKWQEIIRIQI
jgi:hypothetical protein